MEFEFASSLPQDEIRERARAFGDYLQNKHKMQVQWTGENVAEVRGKYKLVKIHADVTVKDAGVHVTGQDPGRLMRAAATHYIKRKLEAYMDPATALDSLPRG